LKRGGLVVQNSLILITARVLTKIATTILMIYVARRLGDIEFGLYATLLSILAFCSIVGEFGLTIPLIRSIARKTFPPGNELGKVVLLKVPLGIVAGMVFLAFALLSHFPFSLSILFATSMFFEVQAVSATRSFEGAELMKYVAVITVVERMIFCGAGFMVLYSGLGLHALGFVSLIANIAAFALGLMLFARKVAPLDFALTSTQAIVMVKEAAPFVVSGIFSVLYNRADVFILSIYRGPAEVGWFNAASRVLEAQTFIPLAIIGSVFPILSRSYSRSFPEFVRLHARVFFFFIGIGGTLSVLTFIFADTVTLFLYKSQYANAGTILRNMSLTVLFTFLNLLVGNALIAAGRERFSAATLGFGACVNVVSNLVVVPQYGAPAAAFVRAASEALSFCIQGFFLFRVVNTVAVFGLSSPPPSVKGTTRKI
jgi:O-antigen/teichoic acid export membrane protein